MTEFNFVPPEVTFKYKSGKFSKIEKGFYRLADDTDIEFELEEVPLTVSLRDKTKQIRTDTNPELRPRTTVKVEGQTVKDTLSKNPLTVSLGLVLLTIKHFDTV